MMPEEERIEIDSFVVKSLALFTYLLCLRAMCLSFVYFNLLRLFCETIYTAVLFFFFFFLCYMLASWWLQDNLSLFIGWSYSILAGRKTIHRAVLPVLVNKQPNFRVFIKSTM